MDPRDYEVDRDVKRALQRLRDGAIVPPPDPARHAALMAAFDEAYARPAGVRSRRSYWYMAALASAAAILIAVGIRPGSAGRHGPQPFLLRDVQSEPSEFVLVPGAASLPPMESGTLVRMEVPVSMLPSFGMTPPSVGTTTNVMADVVVAQDGLPRAVRLVN